MLSIVTDSTAGLSRAEAADLGIDVVPMTYICDGTRHMEGYAGENGAYDELFRKSRAVTSEAVRASAFAAAFRAHLLEGHDVLCVTISSRLSGAYRSACQALEELERDAGEGEAPRVAVVDSWLTSGALECLLRHAASLSREDVPLADAVASLEEERGGLDVLFTVPDMGVLRRSGRLGAIRRSLSTKLNRYPVMTLEHGAIRELGTARGAAGVARAIVERVPDGVSEFVLSHYGERGVEAAALLAAVRKRFPRAIVRVKDGGPVLAKNLGLGAVSLAWPPVA